MQQNDAANVHACRTDDARLCLCMQLSRLAAARLAAARLGEGRCISTREAHSLLRIWSQQLFPCLATRFSTAISREKAVGSARKGGYA